MHHNKTKQTLTKLNDNIKRYLNRPFPNQISATGKWFDILGVALILTIALNVFQPFGLNELDINFKNLLLSGFGLIYASVNTTYYAFVPRLYKNRNWTIKSEIVVSMIIFFVVGILNWLYATVWIPKFSISFGSFLQFQFYTIVFGALPVLLFSLFIENQNLKQSIKSANIINNAIVKPNTNNEIKILQLNRFSINIKDILFFNSYQNYVDIVVYENDQTKKYVHRTTLKQLKQQLADFPQFVQCHKSFIVNTTKIIRAEGNSQGLILNIENYKETIPVSRTFVNDLKKEIKTPN